MRGRHTRGGLVTGVQTCALPIYPAPARGRPARITCPRQVRFLERPQLAADQPLDHRTSLGRRLPVDRICCAGRMPKPHRRVVVCRYHQRSEEHTSELQSLMRSSYAVFCLKKKNKHNSTYHNFTTLITYQHEPLHYDQQTIKSTPHHVSYKE